MEWTRRIAMTRRLVVVAGIVVAMLGLRSITAPRIVTGQTPRIGTQAPELGGNAWIGSAPLTLAALRGHVILVEFWTYG